ncbi:TonB-dependent receptor [Pseudonocardia sp. TMWB2A]|uniref:TonB-dependent receptor plug domain-containing protein n=1 Tax=Pseudonocardia sp. TMWB2A TaxID=687430 RepID=UPI00307FBF44
MNFENHSAGALRQRGIALATVSALAVMLSSPAVAQETDTATASETTEDKQEAESTSESSQDAIIVTGSRIRKSPYNSPDPVTVIDPAISQARGQMNTSEMLQSSIVAAGSSQITSAISSAFVTNGGPGAETVSLRGLGANRTLVLVNGRRAGPAGTRGAVSAFDLNVLPQSVIQSVDILKTGASSVYGSDAIAGVVNIITNKKVDGFDVSAFSSVSDGGGGEQYRVSGTWGKTFDRGHITLSLDYNRRNMLQRNDRKYLSCPEEYTFRPDGSRADLVDPRTGNYRCNDTVWGHVWAYDFNFASVGRWQADYGENLGQYIPPRNPASPLPGFITPGNFYQVGYANANLPNPGAAVAVDNAYHPFFGRESLIPQTDRYTAYLDASYEFSDAFELGVEALRNRRTTRSASYRQFWNYFYTGDYDPISQGWGGDYVLNPVAITDHFNSSQKVDYFRGLVWAKGEIGKGWNWDAHYQYSRSDGRYTQDIIFKDSMDANAYRTGSCVGTTTAHNGKPCIDVNWLDPRFLRGDLTQEERSFLFGEDTGRTLYKQNTFEASASGPLFKLPAGQVSVALGGTIRNDKINDTPGPQTLANNSWGLTSSGITAGKTVTKEAFGEIELPLIYNTPLIRNLTLSASGRVTNVDATRIDGAKHSTKGNWTYSVGANWEVTDWLRFRGRYGTSFRAPALYEQFLANQTGFQAQRNIDPCIGWAQKLEAQQISQRLADNCAAGTGAIAGVPGDHSGAGNSVMVTQGGGLGVLKPETSTAKSASVILTPRFAFLPNTRVSLAVDYFDIKIKGEIATLSAANIVAGCYTSDFFPDDPLCSLFSRVPAGEAGANNIEGVTATFININHQRSKGIDVTGNVRQDLGKLGNLNFTAQMNWQIMDETALFEGTVIDDTGEHGEPRWVGDFSLSYEPSERFMLYYGLQVIGATADDADYIGSNEDMCRTTIARGTYCAVTATKAKFYHSLSGTVKLDKFDFTLGVSNLFNSKPPRVTAGSIAGNQTTVGNALFDSQYDYIGRRFFVNARARF